MNEWNMKRVLKAVGDRPLTLELCAILLDEWAVSGGYQNYTALTSALRGLWYKTFGRNQNTFGAFEWLMAEHQRPARVRLRIPHYLTQSEADALEEFCESSGRRQEIFLLLLLRTGLRVSEMCDIRMQDCRWTTGGLSVFVRTKKTGLTTTRLIEESFARLIINTFRGQTYLFETSGAKKTPREYVSRRIKAIAQSVIGHSISAHTLRHYWSTKQQRDGISPGEVSAMMGHKRIGSRYEYYVHEEQATCK